MAESQKESSQPSEKFFTRLDGILIDAMNTIFLPKAGRYALYRELLETLGIEANLEDIERVYKEKRVFFEDEAAKARERGETGDTGIVLWLKINGQIIQELAPDYVKDSLEMGSWVYEEFLGNPRYFMVPDSMRKFLEAIHGKMKIVIVSNQEQAKLRRFISEFNFYRLVDHFYSSEQIGYEKPDPRFFQAVLRATSLDPKRLLMIGNNIKNDLEGASGVGIKQAVLLDWDNKFVGERDVRRVTDPNQILKLEF